MSNYEIDERERKESQKQRAQRSHGLDERYSSKEGFGRDDQENIKNILRNAPKSSKPCQQWDAQTQRYVTIVQDHIDKENKEMKHDPLGYERQHTPKSGLPLGLKDRKRLEKEEVTNPKHYDKVGFGIQPLEYITANELDFLEGNVIKYVSRYPHKGGVNDLLKARTYIEKLIERESLKNE
jgi:hypothetical protein